MITPTHLVVGGVVLLIFRFIIQPLVSEFVLLSRKPQIPGPKLYALTKWRLALDDWRGDRTRVIDRLHQEYGPVVRIGPDEVHFNSLTALKTIYGAGSGFGRTTFYRMFDVFGAQNMFSVNSPKQHADRKKLLANAYSKSSVMQPAKANMVERSVGEFLDYLARLSPEPSGSDRGRRDEIFTSLHYFSLDAITHFVYGARFGATTAMQGSQVHRDLLTDILDPARRRLFWFDVHLPRLTGWMYGRRGVTESLVRPFLPMQKPAAYTASREHTLSAWQQFRGHVSAATPASIAADDAVEPTIMTLLWKHHISQKAGGLHDMDIASECADHVLAGIDTTADTLTFLLWAMSLPKNAKYQQRLIQELRDLPTSSLNDRGIPTVETTDRLPYLDAVIKETLRLYAPLPASEPRSLPTDTTVDGYLIPAGTTVCMSPYSLHRNLEVFPDPLRFNPERWLNEDGQKGRKEEITVMNRWFWAFSSGARMCIGMHLAMAEMTTLVAAIYRTYTTTLAKESEGRALTITSRFELLYDDEAGPIQEHECYILFTNHEDASQ